MIDSIKSRALRRFWLRNDPSAVAADWRDKLHIILTALDAAKHPEDLRTQGRRFHALTGPLRGRYAVWITGNWRVTFGWRNGNAIDVELEDYHGR